MRDPNNTDKWSVQKGLKENEFYYLYDGRVENLWRSVFKALKKWNNARKK